MMDEFEKKAGEAAEAYVKEAGIQGFFDPNDFIAGAKWARDKILIRRIETSDVVLLSDYRDFNAALTWLNEQDSQHADTLIELIQRLHALSKENE